MEEKKNLNMTGIMRMAAPMIAKGMPLEDVAASCGVENESTILRWMDSPNFLKEVEKHEKAYTRQAARRSRQILIDALDNEQTPVSTKISAARTLLSTAKVDEDAEAATQVINFLGMATPQTVVPGSDDE